MNESSLVATLQLSKLLDVEVVDIEALRFEDDVAVVGDVNARPLAAIVQRLNSGKVHSKHCANSL